MKEYHSSIKLSVKQFDNRDCPSSVSGCLIGLMTCNDSVEVQNHQTHEIGPFSYSDVNVWYHYPGLGNALFCPNSENLTTRFSTADLDWSDPDYARVSPIPVDRYVIGGESNGNPFSHSRLAVDTWVWDSNQKKYFKSGIITFELGGDNGSSSLLNVNTIESLWNFWCGTTGVGVSRLPITVTEGLNLQQGWTFWGWVEPKSYTVIPSQPEQDIILYNKLISDSRSYHCGNALFNNCHLWVWRRQNGGISP